MRKRLVRWLGTMAIFGSSACAPTVALDRPASVPSGEALARPEISPSTASDETTGYATWYGGAFAGRKTASGERFDPRAMTAAHRSLPFGTWVEVTRESTGQSVRVRITDRGPFGDPARIIDLSRAAAERLDMLRTGVARVSVRVVSGP